MEFNWMDKPFRQGLEVYIPFYVYVVIPPGLTHITQTKVGAIKEESDFSPWSLTPHQQKHKINHDEIKLIFIFLLTDVITLTHKCTRQDALGHAPFRKQQPGETNLVKLQSGLTNMKLADIFKVCLQNNSDEDKLHYGSSAVLPLFLHPSTIVFILTILSTEIAS